MPTGIRRTKSLLLRSYREFAAPCLLVVLIIIFGVVEKRSAKSVNRTSQEIAGGVVVKSNEVANNRAYIRYRIPARGKRYWLGSLAERFKVSGGWRKIAETTLRHNGKEVSEKAISDFQFQLEAGQEVLIPY